MAQIPYKNMVIRSSSLDPLVNLAYEELLFENAEPGAAVLYLWRNSDSVVIGRYQNPWLECRLQEMKDDSLILARRFSGGGAVFHDPGNLNFTFITDAGSYDRQRNFRIVLDALAGLGVNAELNERNDITVNDRKVSGSAFKLTRKHACHHGTLLVSADLDRLRRYLKPGASRIESRGIKSVRSEVTNLAAASNAVSIESLETALKDSFFSLMGKGAFAVFTGDPNGVEGLSEKIARHKDPAWLYGKSPDFTHRISGETFLGYVTAVLRISAAVIVEADISTDKPGDSLGSGLTAGLSAALRGRPYFRQYLPEASEIGSGKGGENTAVVAELLELISAEIPEF